MKNYALLSNESKCWTNEIKEWDDLRMELIEGSETEIHQKAKENGFKFVHLFESYEDDYDNAHYKYVTSQIVS